MKHLKLYETYVSTANSSYLPMVTEVPNIQEECSSLANDFLAYLSKDYDIRKGKKYEKKKGNCAWFTEEFYRWCENTRTPMQVIYFPPTDKKKAYIAAYCDGWVIDFTYKLLSKNEKDNFGVSKVEEYKKFGYDPDKAEVYDQVPEFIKNSHPLEPKK